MSRRSGSRRRLLVATSAALAIGVAGCLEENPGADDPHLGDPEPFVEVELADGPTGDLIQSSVVHLVDGGTVEWASTDGVHDATAYHPATLGEQRRIPADAEPWASGSLLEGETFDHTFDGEGVYDYACTIDEERGAVGSVVVGWPEPDEQVALAPPDEARPIAAREELERLNDRVRDVLAAAHDD